ncbi:MAG: hypothetical protein ACRC2W_07155 [Plesiomonas shigelloides]
MNNKVKAYPLASAEQEAQLLDVSIYENLTYSEFQALPQDEQSQLLKLRQQRVIEAPTLYEWDIRVATIYGFYGLVWLGILSPCIAVAALGAYLWTSDRGLAVGLIIMAFALTLFTRYLWLADKQYHYRLTTEGLVTTEHDAIPDAAYAVVRGIAWFGIVVCVVSVALLGPAALVGAGGFALMAFFFTDFKNEETTSTTDIKPGYPHLIKLSHKRPYVDCEAEKFYFGFYSNVSCYCHSEDMHKIISLLMEQLPGSELILFKNDLAVRNSDMLCRDGELVQLSDFESKNK